MPYRIAIASSDGESVNLHFGQAANLLIYEIGDDGVAFIEDREVRLITGQAAHTEDNLNIFAALLKDCSAIFVRRIGAQSKKHLITKNIKCFEVDFSLNHIFNTLLKNQQRGRVRIL
ncbi:MAG: hypothetical protein LBT83_00700 [Tannerella sp.]|jgi:predicted Fe-Mo cluster-binding NifX family protein|nr:hypothetical protein [Tannerella sp.]